MRLTRISFLLAIIGYKGLIANNERYEAVAPSVLAAEQLALPAVAPEEAKVGPESIFKQINKKAEKLSKELNSIEKLRILFNILSLDGDIGGTPLPQHVLTEPYILPSAGLLRKDSLVGIIKPKTIVGEAVLAAQVSAPLTDLDKLNKRRDALKLLVQDRDLRARVKELIESVGQAETGFLNYWDKESQDLEWELKQAFYTCDNPHMPVSMWNPFTWSTKLGLILNRWPQVKQLNRILNVWAIGTLVAGGGAATGICGLGTVWALLQRDLGAASGAASLTVAALGFTKLILWQHRLHMSVLRSLHHRLRHVSIISKTAREIVELTAENPILGDGLSLKDNAHRFDLYPETLAKNLPKLLNILTRRVFNREKFGIFSHAGNVLVAHDYMLEVKDAYHKSYEAIGELSVMLAVAEMIVAHPDQYCFPEFVTSNQPEFTAIDLRNMLFGDAAVPYDIKLGGESDTRVMLLTGPNGAGKSGLLIAGGHAIVCAQALGFAPATSLRLTPFTVIESFSNVKEDLANRLSRFMAERQRTAYILPRLHGAKGRQFAWVNIDEPNSGTTQNVANERSYLLYKEIAQLPNVLCIGTTHHDKATILEKETNGIVKNFYPQVEKSARNGQWIRHFKIVPGIPEWWFRTDQESINMQVDYTEKFY